VGTDERSLGGIIPSRSRMHKSGLPRRLFWAGHPFFERSPQGNQAPREFAALSGWNKLAMEQYSSPGTLEELGASEPFLWVPDSFGGTADAVGGGGAKDKTFSWPAVGPWGEGGMTAEAGAFPLPVEGPSGGGGCCPTAGCSSLLTFLAGGGEGSRTTSTVDSSAKQKEESRVKQTQGI